MQIYEVLKGTVQICNLPKEENKEKGGKNKEKK